MRTQGAALARVGSPGVGSGRLLHLPSPRRRRGMGPGLRGLHLCPAQGWLLLVGSCGVAQGPMQLLGWSASTAPPASTALPSRPPGSPGCGWGRAEEWPRPRPVPPPERLRRGVGHGAGAAWITVDSPTRKGHPAWRPAAGGRAGPTKGGWVGLEKRTARQGASARLLLMLFPP